MQEYIHYGNKEFKEELFKCSYQQSLIPTNENPTEIAKRIEEGIKRSFENHIPRID